MQGHEVIILDNLCNSKRSVLPIMNVSAGKRHLCRRRHS
ncbi:hypothetical protein [Escherichia coli]